MSEGMFLLGTSWNQFLVQIGGIS